MLGAPFGPKSRGGVVTVLGGAAGPAGAWARAASAPTAKAPAPAPSAWTKWRLESVLDVCRLLSVWLIGVPPWQPTTCN